MTSRSHPSVADVGDRHRRLAALAFLAVGCLYAAAAAEHVLPPPAAQWANGLVITMAVLAVAALAPIFLWKARNLSRSTWSLYQGIDGMGAEVLARARTASWAATFLTLVALEIVAGGRDQLPGEFFLQVGLAVMLASFAAVFLVLDRDPGEAPLEEDPGA